ncbi:spore cortex biosynthesis protein YabQ [Bacillus kwashiorkori]|uniref:spore cortex biosynthesis protein YabQ n=1 Tax=Bacillus kwashiorkori TaxID=1522318 RepID=UPI0007857E76|nr:spore cortex biosynthesis protein YabQ [Bacillus kwashiorkori]
MSLTTQFYTMLTMIGMGSWLGAALDTYSRFLKRTKRKRWIVFINDILFWVLQAFILFYVLYLVNNGEVRFYIFLALLCGFAFYQSLLKSIYLAILESIIQLVIKFYMFMVKLLSLVIFKPIMLLFSGIIALLLFTWNLIYRILQIISKIILTILNVISKPFGWIGKLLWKSVPTSFKIKSRKLYKILSRYYLTSKNFIFRKK